MIKGRVWLFGDDINTDVMMPGAVLYGSEEAQTQALFANVRPGWVEGVRAGDIIVAGRNFGLRFKSAGSPFACQRGGSRARC